ncbi:Spo0E like sporulation regulatory protein [Thalassobacillus cyri]|uniref:Spo0E like sporulation regulatory protein n=1 Tax=Thalassobacillus cyri TaxID=571932 RepID=A0A1H4C308_9BACI|nr:aspartyl-phosphate phosphatase Spo0E family protein [Thalassobacillus cyri]SEA54673.1 Spo0E like sporulation regulatory protein [Thalassobacillus cyri]
MNDKELEDKVEQLRNKMYTLYLDDPLNPQVVEVSQSLDSLLNELDFRKNKSKPKQQIVPKVNSLR